MIKKKKINNSNIVITESINSYKDIPSGLILESKDMGTIFQKKGKEILKRGKIFENLNKNV